MIKRLSLLKTENTYPYKNLAVEEYLTKTVRPGEIILFLWQNRRTVVIGRNQNSYKECNVKELEKDGGFLVRRLSGGGAVFHDLGNLNFTFCVRRDDYDVERQTEVILKAVREMGINAIRSGRNDITVDRRKFSGNAFYQTGDFCYHHGTILLNTDAADMAKYLSPDKEKLQAKGVKSVKARVCNLFEYLPDITPSKMSEALKTAFGKVYGGQVIEISESMIPADEIEKGTQRFSSDEWIYKKNTDFDYSFGKRFDWGNAQIELKVSGDKIKDINIWSDAMAQEVIQKITEAAKGCKYDREKISEAIRSVKINDEITETDTEQIKDDIIGLIDLNV